MGWDGCGKAELGGEGGRYGGGAERHICMDRGRTKMALCQLSSAQLRREQCDVLKGYGAQGPPKLAVPRMNGAPKLRDGSD